MELNLEKARKQHMKSLCITGEQSLKDYVKTIFDKAQNQGDALVGLYRMVLPNWDQIERIHGYPQAGEALWKHICRAFMDFDRVHHPNVMASGIWLNSGFSVNKELGPFEISMANCSVDLLPSDKEHQNETAQNA